MLTLYPDIGRHNRAHAKRADVVETTYVTAAATDDAVVYVNQDGVPISTSYPTTATSETQPAIHNDVHVAAATHNTALDPHSEVNRPPPTYGYQTAPTYGTQPAPTYPTSAATSTAADSSPTQTDTPPSGGAPGGGAIGINYSPYHGDHSCKDTNQVKSDFDGFGGYGVVRSYGTDCNQVPNMMNAAKSKNMKIMLGVFDIDNAAAEAGALVNGVKAAGGDWNMVHSVSVGNEHVNSGKATSAQVVAALQTVKGTLKGAGYNGQVAIVDTFSATIQHPELCQASDYAAVNAHAFFNDQTSADEAGKWLQGTVQDVKAKCSGKDVIVTESGWPSQGSSNGAAVPNKQNQQTAISSLTKAFSDGGLFLLSAYNDHWKEDFAGSFGCEKFWGIYGDSPN